MVLLCLALVLVGCGGAVGTGGSSDPSLVVAEDRLGKITAADLDAFVLQLAPGQRWPTDVEPLDWYKQLTRRLAVDRLLHDEAVLLGIDQEPQFQRRERQIHRQAYLRNYFEQIESKDLVSTEDELRAFYEEHLDRYQREERREVFHIFKRYSESGERQAARSALEALRQRFLAGEGFEQLAREASDSETRHEGGRLGLVGRGIFPEDFDRIVFALEPDAPSEIVETADGAHLFLVTSLLEGRSLTFEDVRRLIAEELRAKKIEQAIDAKIADLPIPEGSFIPDREQLRSLMGSGDPRTMILRVGDFEISLVEFREQIQTRARALGGKRDAELPFKVFEELRLGEVLYQHLAAEETPPSDEIESERRRQLIEYYAQRKMTTFVERDAERVQAHYDNNQLRFATPIRVHIRHLTVPQGAQPTETMARLETARSDLDAGRTDLGEVARELGGQVRDLGVVNARQLRQVDPRALRFAFLLEPGEHSPPYQYGEQLALFKVEERQEPVPRPLARTREQVVQDILAHSPATIFRELSDVLLAESDFVVYEEKLAEVSPMTISG